MKLAIRKPALACALLLLAAFSALAPAAAGQQAPAARFDGIMRGYVKENRFSGTVLVARDGKVIFAQAYGLADRKRKLANQLDTQFRIGSQAKQFTATAILLLEQDGKLRVSDTVSQHLPDYPRETGEKLTIHQLLTHTSGIPSLFGPGQDDVLIEPSRKPISSAELVAMFSKRKLNFAPGEKFRYSNSGYILLAAIIEKVSGESWGAFLARHLFAPAGMTRTYCGDEHSGAPRRAKGYLVAADVFTLAPEPHLSWSLGATGCYSTVEDLLKWDVALEGTAVLSAAAKEKLFTAHAGNYAYGWMVGESLGRKIIYHPGGVPGFNALLARYPDDHATAIVLANMTLKSGGGVGGEVAGKLSAALFEK